jgi:phosphoribulokinase
MSSTFKTETRSFRVQAATEYKIPNISLVSKYIVPMDKKNRDFRLNINGVEVESSYQDKNNIYFDFKEIRDRLRDIIPMTKEENDLAALETTFQYNSLCAMNAYKYLPKYVFNESIFTNQDLAVYLITKKLDITDNNFIEMSEEYYVSDIHRNKNETVKEPEGLVPVPSSQLN